MLNASVALHINWRVGPIGNTLCNFSKGVDEDYVLCQWSLKCRLEQDDVQSLQSPRHKPQVQQQLAAQLQDESVLFTSSQFWRKEIVRKVNFHLCFHAIFHVEKIKGRLN